jgi:hypothetical protein
MKVLFLDIDGVVNCQETMQRHRGFIGIDPYLAFLVGNMVDDLKLIVVLSSSWRHSPEGIEEVKKQVCPIMDLTPSMPDPAEPHTHRGTEIKAWLDKHPNVEDYAIIDDDSDMLPEQLSHLFQTSWKTGVTKEVIEKIVNYFNGRK